uniref:Uncharacterized protein n=1 Tax=Arundo donax TaxID=35708 RepID=A0A0A9GXU6_ARUDO
MDMFLALLEIFKRDYILQMLNGVPCDPLILYALHLTLFEFDGSIGSFSISI